MGFSKTIHRRQMVLAEGRKESAVDVVDGWEGVKMKPP